MPESKKPGLQGVLTRDGQFLISCSELVSFSGRDGTWAILVSYHGFQNRTLWDSKCPNWITKRRQCPNWITAKYGALPSREQHRWALAVSKHNWEQVNQLELACRKSAVTAFLIVFLTFPKATFQQPTRLSYFRGFLLSGIYCTIWCRMNLTAEN